MAELDDRPAREQLTEALQPLCPPAWQWVADERKRGDTERTRVLLSQRTIDPGQFGSTARHAVGFTVTVTVGGPDLELAEAELDDDILAFLYALTSARIKWTTATKAIYDGRLGYQLGLTINSQKEQ